MPNPIADPPVEHLDAAAAGDPVRIEAPAEGIATVSINRATRRNSFNAETITALYEAFETLQAAEGGVRLVFLRGEGGTFSAGADLEWMRDAVSWTEADNREDAMEMAKMLKALWDLPCFTVALVEGGAYGGGAGLVAACDWAVAVETAKFSFSEVKLGLIPATISPYVVAAIGPRAARGLFASARVFDAVEAQRVGLVSEVVTDAAGLEAARERLAKEIMACAPGAVADSNRLVEDVAGEEIDHGLMEETARRIARARVGEEGQLGVRAFLDRKKPDWAG
ncbi:MAG: enoyl-CoA hydratase/isomerase family protein [Caulobacteraceae bacterium]|nr:enoyl-CoA hydratase/isomerase family protein [Caulobacteraceae bacterium]